MSLKPIFAATAVSAALLLLQPVFGQQSGASPQPPVPTAQPATGTVTPSAPAAVKPTWTPPPASEPPPAIPQQHPEPMYVTGRVVRDDGLPLSDQVIIESVCDGISHAEGFAAANGEFGFRLGDRNSGIIQDASVSSVDDFFGIPNVSVGSDANAPVYITPKNVAMADCAMRASLAGFRSDTISLGNRRALDNPNVGTIMLHRIGPVDGRAVSVSSLAAPKESRGAFEKGQQALRKNKPGDARKDFEKAAQVYPGYAAAWFELGKLAADGGQFDDALQSFHNAIRADPKYVDPYLSVSAIEAVEKQWPQLAETTGALLRLDAYDYPQAYYMNALANYGLRNFEAAEKSAREAEKLDTQGRFPGSWQVLGAILANRRAFSEAAEQLRGYLKFAPQAADAGVVRAELAQLEALAVAKAKAPAQ